jgi:beta-glucosidase
VEVDVANTGPREGDEVVQLYLHKETASVTQPVLELKRFRRVTLAPGSRTTVAFELEPADLAIWDINMRRTEEPGRFTVYAGPDSVRLKSAAFTLTG